MNINISDDILKASSYGLIGRLLSDKTTKKNILWATDAYTSLGDEYSRGKEILPALITGVNADVIKTRARKAMEQQSERTKQHGEVFTPLWVVKKMNDYADEVYFNEINALLGIEAKAPEPQSAADKDDWKRYVDYRRLEITCGEAPYLATRYDVETGEAIPIENRVGILDRKLKAVTKNAADEAEWLLWAFRALKSTYGYEFQGDNLLIARINILMTFEEYLISRLKRKPTREEYAEAANIIAWNIWQMDALTGTIPYCREERATQLSLFDSPEEEQPVLVRPPCLIFDWRTRRSIKYKDLKGEGKMKFDFIIGNPPYQEKSHGANANDTPIYHYFYSEAIKNFSKVELITPARFLFNAGGTPQEWNKQMLDDPHFKVLWYETNSGNVFNGTDIKGGVAISYYDKTREFGAIGVFTSFPELNSIRQKVWNKSTESLSNFVTNRGLYRYSDKAYSEHPETMAKTADRRIAPSAFERMPELFTTEKPNDGDEYVQILGNIGSERVYRWFKKSYISEVKNLYKYKVLVPKANGSGAIGEVLSTPLIGSPLIGYTETYISIGETNSKAEAEATLKYIKTKFARTMLGILKVTQNNAKPVWKYVPLQNFTSDSDIDWSMSVSEVDAQLYKKYSLDEKEIEFIETHVKEMK